MSRSYISLSFLVVLWCVIRMSNDKVFVRTYKNTKAAVTKKDDA